MVSFMSAQDKEIWPMMGYGPPPNDPLFSYHVQLETRVRKDHPLRKIKELIDFEFIYKEVEKTYGTNGNVSVPPPVVLKLMLLLVLYNVRSERELMDTLPERLDWLWFLGFTIESSIPDHSVLSKARRRWGEEAFKHFFERIVVQCVNAGLVDGTKIFMDSSLIDADASNSSVVDTHSLKRHLNEHYRELEKRLDATEQESTSDGASPQEKQCTSDHTVNIRYVSTTDPDASIVRQAREVSKLRYKTHRAVDGLHEIITAVEVTTGAVNEGYKMASLIETHRTNTQTATEIVVADSQYGTKENFLTCHDKGIKAHMPVVQYLNRDKSSRQGIFSEDKFTYEKARDVYVCPGKKLLHKRTLHEDKQNIEYAASKKDCDACSLRSSCTRSKGSRTVQRHVRQGVLDDMVKAAITRAAKRDLKLRQSLMERSFARSSRFGFDRARWRGLWKVAIQEYLVSAIQNIETLIRHQMKLTKGIIAAPFGALGRIVRACITLRSSSPKRQATMRGLMVLGMWQVTGT
jgi:transposase